MQRFHHSRIVEQPYFVRGGEDVEIMRGRVRLCPYYFVHGPIDSGRAHLGGVLATICPPDKKIIHGMKDAILAPCA